MRCTDCPDAYCFDCWPVGLERVTPDPAYTQALSDRGYDTSQNTVFFHCPECADERLKEKRKVEEKERLKAQKAANVERARREKDEKRKALVLKRNHAKLAAEQKRQELQAKNEEFVKLDVQRRGLIDEMTQYETQKLTEIKAAEKAINLESQKIQTTYEEASKALREELAKMQKARDAKMMEQSDRLRAQVAEVTQKHQGKIERVVKQLAAINGAIQVNQSRGSAYPGLVKFADIGRVQQGLIPGPLDQPQRGVPVHQRQLQQMLLGNPQMDLSAHAQLGPAALWTQSLRQQQLAPAHHAQLVAMQTEADPQLVPTTMPSTTAPGLHNANLALSSAVGAASTSASGSQSPSLVVKDNAGTCVLTGDENRVTSEVRKRIRAFLGGDRTKTSSGIGPVDEMLLHKEERVAGGKKQSIELIFEMNLVSGQWRKIRRVEDLGAA